MPDPTGSNAPRRRWPALVYGGGDEPDPRFSLANERTLLAWIRTALAFLAGAAAVTALDLDLPTVVSTAFGLLLAAAGMACGIQAWLGWCRAEAALRRRQALPSPTLGVVVSVIVLLVGATLVVAVVRG